MKNFINKNKRLTAMVVVLTAIVVIVLIGVAIKLSDNNSSEVEIAEEIDWNELQEPETETETELESESEEETIIYPAPDYEFKTEEVTVKIENIDREYTIAWVSDLQLISDHEAGDVQPEYLDYLEERYETLPVDENGVHAEELWPEIIKYLNYENFDGVIFGGDLMDYCSSSNVAMVKEGLDSLRMRYMYIRSDHDYGTFYGDYLFTDKVVKQMHKEIDGDEISNKFWALDDNLLVLGIDNSYVDMPEYYYDMVEEVLNRGYPVIIATHVPYYSQVDDSLAELSMKERNTLYYWGGKYSPNEITSKYFDLIYSEDTAVKEVLAGHLHASWDGMISNQVSEHIFTPAYTGTIGIIHIVPA
jgi:hypothetical protein